MINKYLLKQTSAACALAVMGALGVPTVAVANQQVTLKSSDGTVNIVGDFVAFEDNNYVVNTGLGDLRISAARVRCEGEACPEINTGSADVVIAGSDTVGLGLMPLLIAGYASHLDADAEIIDGVLLAGCDRFVTPFDHHRIGLPAPVRRVDDLVRRILVTDQAGAGQSGQPEPDPYERRL